MNTRVHKTFKFQLPPTPQQERMLEQVLWRCRELYNAGLQERRDAWQKCGVSITVASQSAQLPAIKEVRPEYRLIHSQVLQDVLTRLDRAFGAFFRRTQSGETPGYPRFQSHTVNNSDPVYAYHFLSVSLDAGQLQSTQVVKTAEGFRLGDSVDELRRIYGDRIRPYEALGMNSVRGYVLVGDGGYLVFNAIDRDGAAVHEFIVTPKIFG